MSSGASRFPLASACMAEAVKPFLFKVVKVSELEDVSHEMLVLRFQHVSSGVSGFPLASACQWGKLQNLSFSKVSKQIVMWFSRRKRDIS